MARSREAQERYLSAMDMRHCRPCTTETERHKHWKSEIGKLAHNAPRLFVGIPPTVLAAKVCPHWWCQHGCASMDKSIPEDRRPRCHWIHPAVIDYTMMNQLGREFANDIERTKDCVQIMPNVNRCHHFAYNGQCMHDVFDKVTGQQTQWCKKGHESLTATFDTFLNTHSHGANLLFETETGLFYKMEEVDLVALLQRDIQASFWFYKPLTTEHYHDWKRLYSHKFGWDPTAISIRERDWYLQRYTVVDTDDMATLDAMQREIYRALPYPNMRSVANELEMYRAMHMDRRDRREGRAHRSQSLPRRRQYDRPMSAHSNERSSPAPSSLPPPSSGQSTVSQSSTSTVSEVLLQTEDISPDDSASNIGFTLRNPPPLRPPPRAMESIPEGGQPTAAEQPVTQAKAPPLAITAKTRPVSAPPVQPTVPVAAKGPPTRLREPESRPASPVVPKLPPDTEVM